MESLTNKNPTGGVVFNTMYSPQIKGTDLSTKPPSHVEDFMNFMIGLPLLGNKKSEDKKSEDNTQGLQTMNKFLTSVGDSIVKQASSIGLNPILALAQIGLESGWGTAIKNNNWGGIKADASWTGKKALTTTKENNPITGKNELTQDYFRVYDTPEEGIADYFKFLAKNKRYKSVLGIEDPYKAAEAMANTGYATDQRYSQKLQTLIKQIQDSLS